MSTLHIGECGRCRRSLVALGGRPLFRTEIVLCPSCTHEWSLSAEARRLNAIIKSLYAEWVERERCETINAGNAQPPTEPKP